MMTDLFGNHSSNVACYVCACSAASASISVAFALNGLPVPRTLAYDLSVKPQPEPLLVLRAARFCFRGTVPV